MLSLRNETLTWIVPEGDGYDEIEAHQDHSLKPITLPVCNRVIDNKDGKEEHDALEGVEQHREWLAHDP